MYSKELEEIIEAALADGVLTDKERAVLYKRAKAEGIDIDEFEIIIEGRLAKARKHEDWLRPTPPSKSSKEKQGIVLYCPSCGAIIDKTHAVCSECGYAFNQVKMSSYMENLYSKLEKASQVGNLDDDFFERRKARNKIVQHKVSIITNAAVPTSKEDMFEFLSAAIPNSKIINPWTCTYVGRIIIWAIISIITILLEYIISDDELVFGYLVSMYLIPFIFFGGNANNNDHNKLARAWKSKSEQIIIKARLAFRRDPKSLDLVNVFASQIGIK